MKEFENKIYRRLLAPVLACLVLALAGCSQDATEAEAPSSPTGGTYLTIVTRGITTTDPHLYEDYVGSLRVIAFKNGEVALNTKLTTTLPNESGKQPDTEVNLTGNDRLLLGSGGGFYTFYFIANEEEHYTTTDNTGLSEALAKGTITAASQLENMQVQFTVEEIKAPTTFGNNTTYMLMSTKMTVYIEEGVDKTIEVKLDRALAKAQLVIQSTSEITNVNVSLPENEIPGSYSLIKQETIGSSSSALGEDIQLDPTTDKPFYDKAESENNQYVSEVVYLPERYLTTNTLGNALKYSITIGGDNQSYTAPIADGTEDPVNYNIIRNYAYTTIGIYDPAVGVTLETLTYTVQPWGTGGGEHTFN